MTFVCSSQNSLPVLKKMQVLRSFPTSARETCIVEAGLRSALQHWEARNFKRRDWKVQIISFQYFLKWLYLIFTFYLYTLCSSTMIYYLTHAFFSIRENNFLVHMKKLARILMYRPMISRPYFKVQIYRPPELRATKSTFFFTLFQEPPLVP